MGQGGADKRMDQGTSHLGTVDHSMSQSLPLYPTLRFLGLTLVFSSRVGSISLDNLQSLSSDNATMAMQQAMMAAHDDSLDGTEEEDEDEMEEEEEEELEEEADELQTTNVSDLGLEHSDSLE